MIGVFRSIAVAISTLTGSDFSCILASPVALAPSQLTPMIATRTSVRCKVSWMWVRKSNPNGMLSISMNTERSPKWAVSPSQIRPAMAEESERRYEIAIVGIGSRVYLSTRKLTSAPPTRPSLSFNSTQNWCVPGGTSA